MGRDNRPIGRCKASVQASQAIKQRVGYITKSYYKFGTWDLWDLLCTLYTLCTKGFLRVKAIYLKDPVPIINSFI